MNTTNFTTVRKIAKGVKMVHQDLLCNHPLDPVAEYILNGIENKVSPALLGHFMQLLRGFDEEMQIEMADDLSDFAREHTLHTTGVIAADIILDFCYKLIAFEHDIVKKGERSRIINKVRV
jgi:hypothetical protein